MKNDIITLVSKTVQGKNVSETLYNVFAEKKSIIYSEFYASYNVGLSPKLTFIIDSMDYNSAGDVHKIIFRGKEYKIIRTFEKDYDVEVTVG